MVKLSDAIDFGNYQMLDTKLRRLAREQVSFAPMSEARWGFLSTSEKLGHLENLRAMIRTERQAIMNLTGSDTPATMPTGGPW